MHTHVSLLAGVPLFAFVLLMGTLWRLVAAHFAGSQSETLQRFGGAMAFQY